MNNNLFNVDKIYSKDVKFVVAVAMSKEENVYCLARIIECKTEFIILKSIPDINEFNEEVKNISKYFNAEIIYES